MALPYNVGILLQLKRPEFFVAEDARIEYVGWADTLQRAPAIAAHASKAFFIRLTDISAFLCNRPIKRENLDYADYFRLAHVFLAPCPVTIIAVYPDPYDSSCVIVARPNARDSPEQPFGTNAFAETIARVYWPADGPNAAFAAAGHIGSGAGTAVFAPGRPTDRLPVATVELGLTNLFHGRLTQLRCTVTSYGLCLVVTPTADVDWAQLLLDTFTAETAPAQFLRNLSPDRLTDIKRLITAPVARAAASGTAICVYVISHADDDRNATLYVRDLTTDRVAFATDVGFQTRRIATKKLYERCKTLRYRRRTPTGLAYTAGKVGTLWIDKEWNLRLLTATPAALKTSFADPMWEECDNDWQSDKLTIELVRRFENDQVGAEDVMTSTVVWTGIKDLTSNDWIDAGFKALHEFCVQVAGYGPPAEPFEEYA